MHDIWMQIAFATEQSKKMATHIPLQISRHLGVVDSIGKMNIAGTPQLPIILHLTACSVDWHARVDGDES